MSTGIESCKLHDDRRRPLQLADLDVADVCGEAVVRVASARTVFANYDLLQREFAQLRDGALERAIPGFIDLPPSEKARQRREILDKWLERQVAFVSKAQAGQAEVNSPISTTREETVAFRPRGYGRTLIFSLAENRRRIEAAGPDLDRDAPDGLVEAKGAGVAPGIAPVAQSHRNGLLQLGEALHEVAMQEVMDRILRHAGAPFRAVANYGVIDLGFDTRSHYGTQRAGLLVRRASLRPFHPHLRPDSSTGGPGMALAIELLLRRYGITSAGPAVTVDVVEEDGITRVIRSPGVPARLSAEDLDAFKQHIGFQGGFMRLEGANVQLTDGADSSPPSCEIVDFGSYFCVERFDHPVVGLAADRLMHVDEVIHPGDRRFVQPDEGLRLPVALWGTTGSIWGYEARDLAPDAVVPQNSILLGFGLARDFYNGKITGAEVRRLLDAYVDTCGLPAEVDRGMEVRSQEPGASRTSSRPLPDSRGSEGAADFTALTEPRA